jgi:hypothetical protein
MLTDDLRARIHAAMAQAHAKTHDAAKLLGMPWQTLQKYIREDEELNAKWSRKPKPPPGEEALIHRPVTSDQSQPVISPEEDAAEIARRLEAEDALVKEGLQAMGLNGDAQQLAIALQKFHGTHYKRSLEMLGGGMTKLFFEIWAELKKVNVEIAAAQEPSMQMILRKDRAVLIEAAQRIFDRANKAALTMAVARHKMSDRGPSEKSAGKPAFGPLLEAPKSDG